MAQWQDWDVQDGYKFSVYGLFILILHYIFMALVIMEVISSETASLFVCLAETPPKDFEGHYMPRRALSPGMHAGLSVIMDVQEREYYCSATESVGFKVGGCWF